MKSQARLFIPLLMAVLLATAATASPLYDHADQVAANREEDTSHFAGNQAFWVENGLEALLLRIHLIRNAQHSIDIQTFILANDECGRLLMCELIEAARRGVRVRLLTDHFMSARDAQWVAGLTQADPNLELRYYRPSTRRADPNPGYELAHSVVFFRGKNQRMHNKLWVFDNKIGLVSGRNIDNHYFAWSTSYNFIDLDTAVIGPAVHDMTDSFEDFWRYKKVVKGEDLVDVGKSIKAGTADPMATRDDFDIEDLTAFITPYMTQRGLNESSFAERFRSIMHLEYIVDDPGKNKGRWIWGGGRVSRAIRALIKRGESEIVMQSPYLVLNHKARRMFNKLRKHQPDMDVIISTNSFASTDNVLAYSGNYRLRSYYIGKLDFHIHELMPQPREKLEFVPHFALLEDQAKKKNAERRPFMAIHAKAIVVNQQHAYVGSYNLDPRSQNLNTENGVLINDTAFAKSLAKTIKQKTAPHNSWVIAERQFPLNDINYLFEGLSMLAPVDVWPLKNTSSFELIPGQTPVAPDHDAFYDRYADVGSFPEVDFLSTRTVVMSIYKTMGWWMVPVL